MILQIWIEKNLPRLAELVCLNGGSLEINGQVGPGAVHPAGNRYGRVGLQVQEAFELTYLRGALDALIASSKARGEEVDEAGIRSEIEREIAGRQISVPTEQEARALLSGAMHKTVQRLTKRPI